MTRVQSDDVREALLAWEKQASTALANEGMLLQQIAKTAQKVDIIRDKDSFVARNPAPPNKGPGGSADPRVRCCALQRRGAPPRRPLPLLAALRRGLLSRPVQGPFPPMHAAGRAR